MQNAVLQSAARILPTELSVLGDSASGLAADLGCGSVEGLQEFFITHFADALLNPPGEAMSKLTGASSEHDVAMLADLYWRCAVAVCQMPLAALKNLARHHSDLGPPLSQNALCAIISSLTGG